MTARPNLDLASTKLRRIRAEDARSTMSSQPEGMALCLELWKVWMGRGDTDLGMRGQGSLRGEGDGYSNSDTAQIRRDNEIAEATDAMIRSLKSSHQWAIRRKCSVATVWRFPQLDFIAEATDACTELEKKLRVNVATRLLF